jgi:hypothetical protein
MERNRENENGVLAEIVEDNPNGTITMYLTLQPCNKSTSIKGTQKTKPDQSCCDILGNIFKNTLQKDGRNVNLCVKAAHTNRLRRSDEDNEDDELDKDDEHDEDDENKLENKLEKNAVDGIKQLMQDGVNVKEMTQKDWRDYLFAMTNPDVHVPREYDARRKDLDESVQETFTKIQTQVNQHQLTKS